MGADSREKEDIAGHKLLFLVLFIAAEVPTKDEDCRKSLPLQGIPN